MVAAGAAILEARTLIAGGVATAGRTPVSLGVLLTRAAMRLRAARATCVTLVRATEVATTGAALGATLGVGAGWSTIAAITTGGAAFFKTRTLIAPGAGWAITAM
ncbi:hypothetical protein AT984_08470 [Paucibacter sp. KCTC 42545]|nr:hypothetical protein AT984_08470 [Paucibacter sp. KCTC 42545]